MSKKPPGVLRPPPPGGVEVFGLGGAAMLAFVVERRCRQDGAAVEEFAVT